MASQAVHSRAPSSSNSITGRAVTKMVSPNHKENPEILARRLALQGPRKTMQTPRRVRILFNGAIIADTEGTSGALYVWEHDYFPQFYLPMEAIIKPTGFDVQLLAGDAISDYTGRTVIAGYLELKMKRTSEPESAFKSLTDMMLFAADLSGPAAHLQDMVKISFDAVDQWFEEDTPIYKHPKDPFKRIDILASSRKIRVQIDGITVAESTSSMHMYETGLPTRYYLPLTSLNTALLHHSSTKTLCAYKGEAQYDSVFVGGLEYTDVCWHYQQPTVECTAITGLYCFYNEKVDIDISEQGKWKRQERPVTHFA